MARRTLLITYLATYLLAIGTAVRYLVTFRDFQISQEALNNVVKHAHTDKATARERAVQVGADAFVGKETATEVLIETIREVRNSISPERSP